MESALVEKIITTIKFTIQNDMICRLAHIIIILILGGKKYGIYNTYH